MILCLLAALAAGCVDENQNLVNPPPQNETIKIRFFNLSSDKGAKILSLDGVEDYPPVQYGELSAAQTPPADSVNSVVKSGSGDVLLKTKWKTKLFRNSNYIFFYMPQFSDSLGTSSDTLYVMSTINGLLLRPDKAYIKLFNAYPDKNRLYYMTIGCPNGEALAKATRYGSNSGAVQIRTDSVPISVFYSDLSGGTPAESRLFKVYLKDSTQYAFVVYQGQDGSEKVALINENDTEITSLTPLDEIQNSTTSVRIVNFSDGDAMINKNDMPIGDPSVAPGQMSDYMVIDVCDTDLKDTLKTYINNTLRNTVALSFKVEEKYSFYVFNDGSDTSAKTVIAEPVYIPGSIADRSVIRVINGSIKDTSITLSVGARTYQANDTTVKNIVGEVLASELVFGNISDPVAIEPGVVPLTLFSSIRPSKLITGSLFKFEPGKEYVIVVYTNNSGETSLYVIVNSEANKALEPIEKGALLQVVNTIYGQEKIPVKTVSMLDNININFTDALATIVQTGSGTIDINGTTAQYTNAGPDTRLLLIATGSKDQPDYKLFDNLYMPSSYDYFSWIVINACRDVPALTVSEDPASESGIIANAENLKYWDYSFQEKIYLDKKRSLYFMDGQQTDPETNLPLVLKRIDDIAFVFNKSYVIIFGGVKTNTDNNHDGFDDGYTAVVMQQF